MTRLTSMLVGCAALLAAAPAADAAPDCRDKRAPRTLLEGQGTLESVAVDPKGRLLFSTPTALMALDRPGGKAVKFADVPEPGGIVFDGRGDVIVGTGNSIENGTTGDAVGRSGLLKVSLETGQTSPFATGLSMANGVVRGRDGFIYATNDFGANVDRIKPSGGPAERGWAKVDSGNGVAIESTGRYLYVAQTFRPAAIAQVDLRNPAEVRPFVTAGGQDVSAGLDGMTIDAADRLFVVANGAGELWRVEGSPPAICVVARGLPKFPDGPSAITVGRAGTPFPPENLYVVTFDGHVYEFASAAQPDLPGPPFATTENTPAPPPPPEDDSGTTPAERRAAPVRLRVTPTRVRARRRTRLTFHVERYVAPAWRPVAGARVRFGGRAVRTRADGRVSATHRFRRRGSVTVRTARARAMRITVR